MSRFETPDSALRRAQTLMQREGQRLSSFGMAAQRMRRMRRSTVSLSEQNRLTRELFSRSSPEQLRRLQTMTPAQQLQEARGQRLTAPSDIGSPADSGTLGPRGFVSQLTSPVVSPEANPLGRLPVVGRSASRMTSPLTSPIGAGVTAAFPGATATGVLGGTALGTFGGGLEEAGVGTLQTPIGGIGPRGVGEFAGGGLGPAPVRAGLAAGGRRIGGQFDVATQRAGGVGRLLASERGGTKVGEPFEEARSTLLESMKTQRKNIKTTAAQRGEERAQRLAASEEGYEQAIREGKSPQEAFAIKRSMQSGELQRVQGVPTVLLPEQEDAILQRISTHDFGRGVGPDFERDRARGALFSLSVGEPVQENEIVTLQKVLGPEFAKQLRQHAKKTAGGLYNLPYELAVAPKAILSSADMSYPLRQGVMLAPGHPVEFGRAWAPMFRAAASEDGAQAINRALIEDPTVINLADGRTVTIGRALQDTNALRTLDPSLTTSEEAFRGSLAERIPGLGHIVRASNRAFTTFGNKFRGDVFKTIAQKWQKQGVPITDDRLQNLSNMLNRFSGRGTLADSRLTNLLQATWWAPQTRVAPAEAAAHLFNLDGAVRAEAWRNMAAFMGTGLSILGAAKLSGLKVGVDPRDTDFGKIQIGKTHVNIWGPSQVMSRTIARIMSGQRIDINRGVVPTDRISEAVRYFRSGLAPEWAIIWDAAAKENMRGQALDTNLDTLKRELPERLLPLAVQDMYEAIKEEGAAGALVGPATFFGESVSTYGPTIKQQVDAIPQFKGLSLEEYEQIREFNKKVELWRNEQEEEYGEADADFERSIERVAEKEKFDPTLAEWAKVLRNKADTERNRNPEYDQFILDHWDEVKRDAPYLINDRLRKLHATQAGAGK